MTGTTHEQRVEARRRQHEQVRSRTSGRKTEPAAAVLTLRTEPATGQEGAGGLPQPSRSDPAGARRRSLRSDVRGAHGAVQSRTARVRRVRRPVRVRPVRTAASGFGDWYEHAAGNGDGHGSRRWNARRGESPQSALEKDSFGAHMTDLFSPRAAHARRHDVLIGPLCNKLALACGLAIPVRRDIRTDPPSTPSVNIVEASCGSLPTESGLQKTSKVQKYAISCNIVRSKGHVFAVHARKTSRVGPLRLLLVRERAHTFLLVVLHASKVAYYGKQSARRL